MRRMGPAVRYTTESREFRPWRPLTIALTLEGSWSSSSLMLKRTTCSMISDSDDDDEEIAMGFFGWLVVERERKGMKMKDV